MTYEIHLFNPVQGQIPNVNGAILNERPCPLILDDVSLADAQHRSQKSTLEGIKKQLGLK